MIWDFSDNYCILQRLNSSDISFIYSLYTALLNESRNSILITIIIC